MHARLQGGTGEAGQALAPLGRGANGSRRKSPVTVRADVVKFMLYAVGAKGAFEAADARITRLRRQIAVAELAIGSNFHLCISDARAGEL